MSGNKMTAAISRAESLVGNIITLLQSSALCGDLKTAMELELLTLRLQLEILKRIEEAKHDKKNASPNHY